IAMVKGWSVGGGKVLQLVCDLTIAADNAMFGQTGPKVGSFDAGYGSGYLARVIGHKRAKEVWFLNHCYTAQEAYEMNWINKVVSCEAGYGARYLGRLIGHKRAKEVWFLNHF